MKTYFGRGARRFEDKNKNAVLATPIKSQQEVGTRKPPKKLQNGKQ